MDTHLLIVCVRQVRNLCIDSTGSSPPSYTLILETRFHDETLTLDPIEVTRATEDPIDISSELAWILSKRSLHEAKIKRLPVKLQVYLFDTKLQEKRLLGYHIFDIRSVQETETPKFEWKPLLNLRYKGSSSNRPEILCALQVTRDDTSVPSSIHQCNGHTSHLITDLQVKETDNVIKIWDAKCNSESDCTSYYLFSIVIATVSNLDQFLRTKETSSSSPLSFHYTIFGKFCHTKYFYCDQVNFPVERITFKLASSNIKSIKSYFDLNPMLQVTLCTKNDQSCIPLAYTSLFLKSLTLDTINEPIIGEFTLQPIDETLVSSNSSCIGVCVELESVSDHLQSNRLNTGINGSTEKHMNGDASVKSFNATVDPDDVHHYCFSIDLRSITVTDASLVSHDCSYFLQFSYAIFGQTDTIETSKVQFTDLKTAVTFKDGYFAFNFASSWNQLVASLCNVPIIFQLVQVNSSSPSKSTVRGLCKLHLSDIVNSPPDLENKKLIVKKPMILDHRDGELATINTILCLQDLGVVPLDTTSLAPLDLSVLHQHLTSPLNGSSNSKEGQILQKLFIDAAIEIELWKQLEMMKFTHKLTSKCHSTDAAKSTAMNGTHATNGNNDTLNNNETTEDEVTHLSSIRQLLAQRESQLNAKEVELEKANQLYTERYNKLQDEILTAIEEIKGVYEEKLSKERCIISKLEEQNRKLSDEIVALKSQVKSSATLSSSLVRINSVPNSVRSASKVRQAAPKQTALNSSNDQQVKSKASLTSNKDNRSSFSKPSSPLTRNSSSTVTNVRRSPLASPNKGSQLLNNTGDRKSIVLQELKNERDTLLKKGLCRSDDPMIKTIEKELRRNGVRTK